MTRNRPWKWLRRCETTSFDLDDFLDQMQQIKKMGPLKDILGMIPGLSQYNLSDVEVDPKAMAHVEAIIQSMTKAERQDPSILNGPRKKTYSQRFRQNHRRGQQAAQAV